MKLGFIERWIENGALTLHWPPNDSMTFGQGTPHAHVHLRDKSVLRRLLHHPDIAMGEGYMDGDWWPGEGGLKRVFELYFANGDPEPARGLQAWLRNLVGHALDWNNRLRARRNVVEHYDLDHALFESFLDADMQYSCAYFADPDFDLEQAQRAKCRHIAEKLLLQPGQRVLDIGSGWGGMALFLAEHYGVEVTGLTLSEDQYEESRRRAQARGLENRTRFLMQDYRDHEGEYDAIVSVGMFEHVGRAQYQAFFDQVDALLAPDGRALIHFIGRNAPPCDGHTWVQKYIFPGGYIPSLSEVATRLEKTGLVLSDLEVWRRHYAKTLAHWTARFQASREATAQRMGERFCRMWEYYLIGCEAIFLWGDLVVYHFQLGATNHSVPLTRDYLYRDENSVVQRRRAG